MFWTDGTKIDYTNWKSGDPNNGGGNGDGSGPGGPQYCVSLANIKDQAPLYKWCDTNCFKAVIGSAGIARAVCKHA